MRQIAHNLLRNFHVAEKCIVLSFLLPFSVHSQNWTMPVYGKVFANNTRLAGSIVTLYKNDIKIQEVITSTDGIFNFRLPSDAEYIITITKPGFITKKLQVNTTNVPADRVDTVNFIPFQPQVTLFEMPVSPEIAKRVEAILSQPLAIYQYVSSERNFNYDQKYAEVIKSRIAELADLQKRAESEMEETAKSNAIEAQKQLELDKKYQAIIDKADKEFNNKDYVNAKEGYKAALVSKPEEPYPKQKIAEIDKLLSKEKKE